MRPTSTCLSSCRNRTLFIHRLILWVIFLSQNGYLSNESHAAKPGSLVRIEDLEQLCLKKENESNYFLYTYESLHEGCTVNCIFLTSTFQKGYFDKTVIVPSYFNGHRCRDENHICDFGSCKSIESTTVAPTPNTKPTQFGTVILFIKDGNMRNADAFETTPPDPYVKIKSNGYRTPTAKNTYRPLWNHEVTLHNVNVDANLTLVIMDEDKRKDDELGKVIIVPRQVLNNGNNAKFVEYSFGDKLDYINVRLTWYNQ